MVGLERALDQYVRNGDFDKQFDIKQVPVSTQPITATESKKSALSVEAPPKKEEKVKATRQDIYARTQPHIVSQPLTRKFRTNCRHPTVCASWGFVPLFGAC